MTESNVKAIADQVNSLAITVGNLEQAVENAIERIGDLEDQQDVLHKLPERVAELKGLIAGLQVLVTTRFDAVQPRVDKLASLKYLLQFAGVVIVPILIALIGAYFVARSGGATGK